MKQLLENIVKVEKALANRKGAFNLFALFLREDAPGKWDLVVAAPWAEKGKISTLRDVATELQRTLSKNDLLQLSRIVVIDDKDPALHALQRSIHVEHGTAEIQDSNLFGLQIRHAYLITSRRSEGAAPNKAYMDSSRKPR